MDRRARAGSFQCTLPSATAADALDVTVSFAWSVTDPLAVVRERVTDAPAVCQARLVQIIQSIRRDLHLDNGDVPDSHIAAAMPPTLSLRDCGLSITGARVAVRRAQPIGH